MKTTDSPVSSQSVSPSAPSIPQSTNAIPAPTATVSSEVKDSLVENAQTHAATHSPAPAPAPAASTDRAPASPHAAYWEAHFHERPYARRTKNFQDFEPAFRLGWERAASAEGRSFNEVAAALEHEWPHVRGTSNLVWERARYAVRDAWEHAGGLRSKPSTPLHQQSTKPCWLSRSISARPFTSVGIALGMGVALGLTCRRMGSHR